MGQVVVKYKVTMDQPEDEMPDYEGIAGLIDNLPEEVGSFKKDWQESHFLFFLQTPPI